MVIWANMNYIPVSGGTSFNGVLKNVGRTEPKRDRSRDMTEN